MYSFKIGRIGRETIPHPSYSETYKITTRIDYAVNLLNTERMAVGFGPGGCAAIQLNIKRTMFDV